MIDARAVGQALGIMLTPAELAAHYKVSERTISRLTADGMPSRLVGRHRRYDLAETDAWHVSRPVPEAPKTRLTQKETMEFLAGVMSAAFSGTPRPPTPALPLAISFRRRPSAKPKLLRQTPPWANQQAIGAVYEEARRRTAETGVEHHVDHVYPLRGKLVSGLHVETNLEVLTALDNRVKNNRYEP